MSDPDQVHKSDAGGSFQQPLARLRAYCATFGDCHPTPIKVAAVPGSRFHTPHDPDSTISVTNLRETNQDLNEYWHSVIGK